MKSGRLFLQAGSPTHAADVFREILQDDPENADALTGLGEAEFARGNYREAERDFQAALKSAPDHAEARQMFALANEVLGLDPTIRGLGPTERFRRSLMLLHLTVDDTNRCIGQSPPAELADLLDRAAMAQKARVSGAQESEAAESNLDLAEQLWQARRTACQPAPAAQSPLALVLARIAQ
jgi:tetratricopeptide (TPR) repeat protein